MFKLIRVVRCIKTKSILPILFQNSCWVIGNGPNNSFWVGKWLGTPILEAVSVTEFDASLFHSKVLDIISMEKYSNRLFFLFFFSSKFLELSTDILEGPFPIIRKMICWFEKLVLLGLLFFLWDCSHRFLVQGWVSIIWRSLIPLLFLIWRIIFNKLPMEEVDYYNSESFITYTF